MLNKTLGLAVLTLAVFAGATPLTANTELGIDVVFLPPTEEAAGQGASAEANLKRACSIINDAFVSRKSARWFMPFSTTNCRTASKLLSETESPARWRLTIDVNDATLIFKLILDPNAGTNDVKEKMDSENEDVWQELRINTGKYTIGLLNDEKLMGSVATYLVDSLPYSFRFTYDDFSDNGNQILGPEMTEKSTQTKSIYYPEKIIVYTLIFDGTQRIFRPHVLGRATKSTDATRKQVTWNYTGEKIPEAKNVVLLGHNSTGRSRMQKKINGAIQKRIKFLIERANRNGGLTSFSGLESIASAVTNNFSAGYAGVRYGIPILKSDPLVSKASFIGVTSQFRAGPLSGFKLFVDIWPEVKANFYDVDSKFGGHRALVGWSFRMDLDDVSLPFDSLLLTPQLGAWNFRMVLPVEDELGVFSTIEFNIENAPSLAIELAVESSNSWYLVQPFVSRSIGAGTKKQVSMLRLGIDAAFAPPNWQLFSGKVSLLLFSFLESATFPRSTSSTLANHDEIQSVKYTQAFGGLGGAYSW